MRWITIFLLSIVTLLLIACSSGAVDNNATSATQTKIIAPQPLTYHDDANITFLTSDYGTFGSHRVKTKSIPNTHYDYKPAYQALDLQSTLYYPEDINTSRPTLFFYSGYHMYHPDAYKALLYFVASKGYNIIFLTCPEVELRNLTLVTEDAIEAFATHIDKTKVGFIGHSMGAGVAFWLIEEFKEKLGSQARLLFPMASGYTVFNSSLIPEGKLIPLPSNTKMIQQVYASDYSTDIRIGIDLFLNNTIEPENRDFMLIYGDQNHTADHGTMAHGANYDALMQRTIFRPLDALMDETFNNKLSARSHLKTLVKSDPYFTPYLSNTPQSDIEDKYILPETNYSFNCSEGGNVISKRKEYCQALGL